MTVRFADEKDVELISKMDKNWVENENTLYLPENYTYHTVEELKNKLHDDSKIILVAEDDGKIIGYLIAAFLISEEENFINPIKKGETYIGVDCMYVLKEYRNKGIGTQLFEKLMDSIKKANVKYVKLIANSQEFPNKIVNFYKKHGFKVNHVILTMMSKEIN